jgi:uncharacterized membrane protein YgaE (UPF0421/DUF939 family)
VAAGPADGGAVIAWLIAVLLTCQPDPLFAPMAAVIALNAALGRRGSNAVRLVVGVVAGWSLPRSRSG